MGPSPAPSAAVKTLTPTEEEEEDWPQDMTEDGEPNIKEDPIPERPVDDIVMINQDDQLWNLFEDENDDSGGSTTTYYSTTLLLRFVLCSLTYTIILLSQI
jgi:hypothetical protein